MSMADVHLITRQANLLRSGSSVICRYEWFRVKARFQWSFYRQGHYLGGTCRSSEVVGRMAKYVSTKASIDDKHHKVYQSDHPTR